MEVRVCVPVGHSQSLTEFCDPEGKNFINLPLNLGWAFIQRPIQFGLGQCSGHIVLLPSLHLGALVLLNLLIAARRINRKVNLHFLTSISLRSGWLVGRERYHSYFHELAKFRTYGGGSPSLLQPARHPSCSSADSLSNRQWNFWNWESISDRSPNRK